jgi:subtilisin family serine protease
LNKITLICILIILVRVIAAQEIIVRLSDDVTITPPEANSLTYLSNNSDIQEVLALNPPRRIVPLFQKMGSAPSFLQNIQIWHFQQREQSQDALSRLQELDKVIYAEPNRAFRITEIPNDEFYDEQWYLGRIQAPAAWDIEKGSPSVIVGVIDTGIDYKHEDLKDQLWINSAEDLNQNGRLDSTDIDGLDEDNNGYVDDVIGWDFTDAPNFPDDGDYLDPDNDPMDEYLTGHGTPVAGVISARQNNLIGISGVAPNVRLMALRAGTARGFLEEDDVAEAIVYAADNGCKVVNMSFGDVAYSYLIHDAVQYATNMGVLFVAASGNSGNVILQYPAAYDETISVGATTSSNTLAGFSSYGNKLNLVAPGQEIFSCQINNAYGSNSGTSFSAPVVSAALALIWSKYPNYPAERIKGALFAGCADLGSPGWDIYSGHGVVDIYKSLTVSNYGFAEIRSPAVNDGISMERIPIIGTVFSPNLISYSLKVGIGENPQLWDSIGKIFGNQVIDDTLALWDTANLADTAYVIELRLKQYEHPDVVFRTQVYIDHSPPIMSDLTQTEMLFGDANGVLIGFETDDPTLAILQFGDAASGPPNQTKTSPYLENKHYFALSQEDISGSVNYLIQLKNSSGIESIYDNNGEYFQLAISGDRPVESIFSLASQHSFSGYMLPFLTDLNSNQQPEIVVSRRADSVQYGPLQIWESQNQQFELRGQTGFPAIPRDVNDIDLDGSPEILAGLGGTSMILEKGAGAEFPLQIAWIDSSNIWGSRLVDLDGDQIPELLAIQSEEWRIFDLSIPGYHPVLKQTLSNPTSGNNQYGIPWCIVDDLDQDGLIEIVYGDYDGDILVFEDSGTGLFQLIWSKRFPGVDATYLFQVADVNGDGKTELIAVVRNEPSNLTESTVLARYWHMEIWQAQSSNQFVQIWEKNFQGVNTQRNVFNGLNVEDIDSDGVSEIYFTPFPRAYQIKHANGNLEIGWYHEGSNTNTAVKEDVGGNGMADIFLNTDLGVQQFEYEVNNTQPPPPAQLTGTVIDTFQAELYWGDIPGADYYKIYRGNSPADLTILDSSASNSFVDSSLSSALSYFYTITQVNHSFPQPESKFSNIVSIRPNSPPQFDTLIVVGSRQLLLLFNEPMSDQTFSTDNFVLLPENGHPVSAIRGHSRYNAIISFQEDFSAGQNDLFMFNMADQQGTPMNVDTLEYSFVYNPSKQPLYLKNVESVSKQQLSLAFSNLLNWESAGLVENYSIYPDGRVLYVSIDTLQSNIVTLHLDESNRLGSLGVPYYVEVGGITDIFGNTIASELGNRLLVTQTVTNLDNVIVYPNPYNSQTAEQPFRFANLPLGSEIYIFSAGGNFIRELNENNSDGGVIWDLRSESKNRVGSGVYFYLIRFHEAEVKGKFVIIN